MQENFSQQSHPLHRQRYEFGNLFRKFNLSIDSVYGYLVLPATGYFQAKHIFV